MLYYSAQQVHVVMEYVFALLYRAVTAATAALYPVLTVYYISCFSVYLGKDAAATGSALPRPTCVHVAF